MIFDPRFTYRITREGKHRVEYPVAREQGSLLELIGRWSIDVADLEKAFGRKLTKYELEHASTLRIDPTNQTP